MYLWNWLMSRKIHLYQEIQHITKRCKRKKVKIVSPQRMCQKYHQFCFIQLSGLFSCPPTELRKPREIFSFVNWDDSIRRNIPNGWFCLNGQNYTSNWGRDCVTHNFYRSLVRGKKKLWASTLVPNGDEDLHIFPAELIVVASCEWVLMGRF